VDLKLVITVLEARDEHGIVKVAGGFAVNGDDGQMAEITARGDFFLRDDGVDLLRFFQHLRGKDVRDMVLADDHLHVDAEIVFIAEDFSDASAGALCGGRPLRDFYFDDDVFQVVPGFALGFFAEDPVRGLAGGVFGSGSFVVRRRGRLRSTIFVVSDPRLLATDISTFILAQDPFQNAMDDQIRIAADG